MSLRWCHIWDWPIQLYYGQLFHERSFKYVSSLLQKIDLIWTYLAAKYIISRQCDLPIPQLYPEADPATIVPFILATILFAIRMTAKFLQLGGGWGPDDYTVIIAYVKIPFLVYRIVSYADLFRDWQSLRLCWTPQVSEQLVRYI